MTSLSAPDLAPPRPHAAWTILFAASLALGAAALALIVMEGRPWPAALMALALVAAGAIWLWLRLPVGLNAVLALATVVNGMSIAWDWYTIWPPFDEWAHLLNPILLVAPSMIWFHRAGILRVPPDSGAGLAVAAAYGFALAFAWEVIELFFWLYPISDTVSDIGLGVLGSVIGGWVAGRLTSR
jgi:hypothetical protein